MIVTQIFTASLAAANIIFLTVQNSTTQTDENVYNISICIILCLCKLLLIQFSKEKKKIIHDDTQC